MLLLYYVCLGDLYKIWQLNRHRYHHPHNVPCPSSTSRTHNALTAFPYHHLLQSTIICFDNAHKRYTATAILHPIQSSHEHQQAFFSLCNKITRIGRFEQCIYVCVLHVYVLSYNTEIINIIKADRELVFCIILRRLCVLYVHQHQQHHHCIVIDVSIITTNQPWDERDRWTCYR